MAFIFYQAAAGLPIITALALISGRRGNALFFLWGGQKLLKLNLLLCIACPIYIFCSYYGEIAHYGAPVAQQLAPLLAAPGMPWMSAFIASICAFFFIASACFALGRLLPGWRSERLTLRQIRFPLLFCILAAISFFASFLLLLWPFAGLPGGLAWEQAIPALFRHAMRNYFMAFSASGAVALLALFWWTRSLDAGNLFLAVRYFSFWAAAGLIPHWLITWGMRLGMGAQSARVVGQGVKTQDPALILLTLAMFCWVFLLWKPQYWRSLGVVAFMLFLARAAVSHVQNLM